MILQNPVFVGFLGAQNAAPATPAARALTLTPLNPGTLAAGVTTVNFTVGATNVDQIKWARFDGTGALVGSWTTVPVAANQATFTATFSASGQRVRVRTLDDAVEVVSGQVVLTGTGAPTRPAFAPRGALDIEPYSPGTLTPVNGVATWQTWIGSNLYGTLLHTEVNGAAAAQPFSFKGDWRSIALIDGWALVTFSFDATGQFAKIANPGNPTEQMDSGTVTLTAGTTTPTGRPAPTAALVIDPLNPGTINPVNGRALWTVYIGSNTVTTLSWAVFEGAYANYASRGGYQNVTLDAAGWAQITAEFTQTGQFLKIANAANLGQTLDSGAVTVPVQQPTDPLPVDPTPTPTPTGTPVARLDVLMRGQSNVYYAQQNAGGPNAMRAVIANLTQIPDVRLISRVEVGALNDNTIHSGTYSYADVDNQAEWLKGIVGVNPGLWALGNPLAETLLAVERYVSTDPNHGLLDVKVHWEYDMKVWQGEWNSMYRQGQWEITKRIRTKAAKNANRVLTGYGHCSYEGGSLSFIGGINDAWVQDWTDGTLMAVCAAGNMCDGQARLIGAGPDYDWSHNDDPSLLRQYVRMGIYLSRKLWEVGWCPSGVDLSWLPSLGPKIASGSRSGSSVFLTIQHDKGTAMQGGADGTRWSDFWVPQLGGHGYMNQDNNGAAIGGAFTAANQIRVDFKAAVPAGSELHYCFIPRMTAGTAGRTVVRDNWNTIRPAASNTIPNIGLFDNLLQRTWRAVALT